MYNIPHVSTINPPPTPYSVSLKIDCFWDGKNSGQLLPAEKFSSLTAYLFYDDEYKQTKK